MKSPLKQVPDGSLDWVASWFVSAFFLSTIYRLSYFALLNFGAIPGIFINPESCLPAFFEGFRDDILISLFLGIPLLLLARRAGLSPRDRINRWILGIGVLFLILLALGYVANFESAYRYFVSLNYSCFRLALSMADRGSVLSVSGPVFGLLVVVPLLWRACGCLKVVVSGWIMAVCLALALFTGFFPLPFGDQTDMSVTMNPWRHFYLSWKFSRPRVSSDWNVAASVAQQLRPDWIDPEFVGDPVPAPIQTLPQIEKHSWNVVWVIVEAMGADFPFDTSIEGRPPMPFLTQLARKGVWLRNHYSSSNNSAPASFSLFSGRYPPLNSSYLAPGARTPLANEMLNETRSFFVRPGAASSFFPGTLFGNAGFEGYDYSRLEKLPKGDGIMLRRLEPETFRFFLDQLHGGGSFFASYISFVPHFYYEDNGPEYRRYPLNESSDYRQHFQPRFYNGLYLMDRMIQSLVSELETSGRIKDTILVVVGDHGEGFDPSVFLHGMNANEAIIKTTCVIYQPALFPPQQVEFPTSHVDLLPTMLPFMRTGKVPRMTGEDLTRPVRRKYIFSGAYAVRGDIVSISRDGFKLWINDRSGSVKGTHLRRDPNEKSLLPVQGGEQLQAALKYRTLQLRPLVLMPRE